MLLYLVLTTLRALEFGGMIAGCFAFGFLVVGQRPPIQLLVNFGCWCAAIGVGVAYVGQLVST